MSAPPKSFAQWTRDESSAVIVLYEQEPCLYEVTSTDYKNRNKRQAALEKIAVEMCPIRSNTTASQVKTKLNGLRTQFLDALNKLNTSKKSGAGTDSICVPTLWCYEQLAFLEQHTIHFKGVSNISDTQDQEENVDDDVNRFDEVFEEEVAATQSPSTPGPQSSKKRKLKESPAEDEFNRKADAVFASIQSRRSVPKPQPDNLDIFGLFVVSELRGISNPRILKKLKRQIQADILEAQELDDDLD